MESLPAELVHKILDYLSDGDLKSVLECGGPFTYPEIFIKRRKWISMTMESLAKTGDLEGFKYLHSIGKDCTHQAMNLASMNGHLETVKYLHSIGKECMQKWSDEVFGI